MPFKRVQTVKISKLKRIKKRQIRSDAKSRSGQNKLFEMDENGQIRSDQKNQNGHNKPIEKDNKSPINSDPKEPNGQNKTVEKIKTV